MIPVDQTRFYEPELPVEEQRGNCLQAVIASLLECPLSAVPHFVQDHVDNDGDNNPEWHWWLSMINWLKERGHRVVGATLEDEGWIAVSGPSPRGNGIYHIVIYKDGLLAHDPHPDRTGIIEPQSAWRLE